MGLGKVIGWGFLALVLFSLTALMLLGLVYGIKTNWATKKLRIAYAHYKFEKTRK
jgi:hypothetical protein